MLNFMDFILPLAAVLLICLPFIALFNKKIEKKKLRMRLLMQISAFMGLFLIVFIVSVNNFMVYAETVDSIMGTTAQGLGFLSAALATGCSAIGAGIAVASAAPAAIGAISENEENFGKAIIFVALAEGVAIYGLLISILIINKL
ncbi:MAG: ATP synthase subunit C [Erysipelotrichaceae bacterium]